MSRFVALVLLLLGANVPTSVAAQSSGTVSISEITVSADSVQLGDLVDLSFVVELAPGTLLFLPDSLDSSDLESIEPVRWTAAEGAGGATRLTVTYPLIAFQVGSVAIPEFPVFAARSSEATSAGYANDGDFVGSWLAFRAEPSEVPSAQMLLIPAQPVQVASVLQITEATDGVQPRPVADIVGGERNWPATLLVLAFALGVLLAGVSTVRLAVGYWRVRSYVPPDPRDTALSALDALFAEGAHRSGDVRSFYARASDITRRFVERLDEGWGPAFTSTELMTDLGRSAARRGESPLPPAEPLATAMDHAEMVKFGGDRPEPDEAEKDWRTVRSWVEQADSSS